MDNQKLIELAKQAGPLITTPFDQWCENFAHLVRAQTLEEAAGVCEARSMADFPQTQTGLGFSFSQQWDAARTAEKQCAAAIRALKESKT